MKKVILLLAIMMVPVHSLYSQPFNQAARDSIRKLTEQDHRRMMDLLGIVSLRPGVNGMDPNAPDAANYDETKANPYPVLPDPLNGHTPGPNWPVFLEFANRYFKQ